MANGNDALKRMLTTHYEKAEEGSFEYLMSAFALEMISWKSKQWKSKLFILACMLVPITILVLDKVLQ